MKPSQIYYRLRKMAHLTCTLGVVPEKISDNVVLINTIPELDFDPVFLAKFPVEELMEDQVTLLHETEIFHWDSQWEFPNHTPLWNYNLHYFEYLFPLVRTYKVTGDRQYLAKVKDMIQAWIWQNPRQNNGVGWASYPIALRLTNWLAVYGHLEQEFNKDDEFHKVFIASTWEQYDCLAHHLERDLLGNHYYEDLKALILCALFFNDKRILKKALDEFHKQCREQILPDGMHFELSPMYHKLIFEDLMRVAVALRGADKKDDEIESYLQSMLDVAYSLEEGLDRIPLFNDCGHNVAKSLDALCAAAKVYFNLIPNFKSKLPDSGYYIFKWSDWKMIVDAGQPGPMYLPGHAHCDAMSFELFKAGKPVIVNCGTYAYQCDIRAFFRSTAAHNTVQVEGVEQSQCWGAFRMGKRSRVEVLDSDEKHIVTLMKDQAGVQVKRTITIDENSLRVADESCERIISYIHLCDRDFLNTIVLQSYDVKAVDKAAYAPSFGEKNEVCSLSITGKNKLIIEIPLCCVERNEI